MRALYGFLMVLCACGAPEKKSQENLADTTLPQQQDTIQMYTTAPLPDDSFVEERVHVFSDPGQADTFRLTIRGRYIREAAILFEIISSKGKTIHAEKFEAASLIGYGLMDTLASEEEAYIRKRIFSFFSEDNFETPATKADENFSEEGNFADRNDWEDIHADRSATGFFYLLDKENGRCIAWSKKLKKVVVYRTCC